MPLPNFQRIHRVPKFTIHEDIQSLNREGERVVSVVSDGDYFVVITEPIGWPPPVETRVTYGGGDAA